MIEKNSYGILCISNFEPQKKVLMVKKKYTYAFNMFVHGKYNPSSSPAVIDMFNNMTLEEKMDIMSLSFKQMWYRIWNNFIPDKKTYETAKKKFNVSFKADNGVRLNKLMCETKHTDKIWEIPKGKKKYRKESNLICAMREFEEETGMKKENYKIYPDKLITYSYKDDGIRYINNYFIAIARNTDIGIRLKNKTQLDEISDIRWLSIVDIRLIDNSGRLYNFIKEAAKYYTSFKFIE